VRNIHVDSFNSPSASFGNGFRLQAWGNLDRNDHLGSEDNVLYLGFREGELIIPIREKIRIYPNGFCINHAISHLCYSSGDA
jgi:hypothetical protein